MNRSFVSSDTRGGFLEVKDIENGLLLYIENKPETIFRYRYGNENDKNALLNNL